MNQEPGLPKFEYLPEHKELCKGFFVRVKGSVYHIQWRDPVTKKMRSRRGGKTYTEVIDTISQIAPSVTIGQRPAVSGSTQTWQVIEDWFEREVIPKKKQKTAEIYAYYLERLVLPTLGEARISRLTTPLLEEFFERIDEFDTADPARKRTTGVSTEQVNTVKKIVKSLFRWAHSQGYILRNPATSIRQEIVEPTERPVYVPEQFEFLVEHANPYYRPHLLVLYWSSIRIGELGALSWSDIVFRDDGRVDLYIRHGLSSRRVDEPKTRKSKRVITLPKFIAAEMKGHRERQMKLHEQHPNGLAFTTSTGLTLDIGRFRERVLYKALERANKELERQELPLLPKVSPHGLRHSSITLYTDRGSSLPEAAVQKHAGHTNQRTTDRYTHLDQKRREAIADIIERAHAEVDTSSDETESEIA